MYVSIYKVSQTEKKISSVCHKLFLRLQNIALDQLCARPTKVVHTLVSKHQSTYIADLIESTYVYDWIFVLYSAEILICVCIYRNTILLLL